MEIWFGKHKGKQVEDLPTDYLRWLADGFDPVVEVKHVGRNAPKGFAIDLYQRRRELIEVATDELVSRDDDVPEVTG